MCLIWQLTRGPSCPYIGSQQLTYQNRKFYKLTCLLLWIWLKITYCPFILGILVPFVPKYIAYVSPCRVGEVSLIHKWTLVGILFTLIIIVFSGGGGNFILSSSNVGGTKFCGGFAPMVEHGYGVCYTVLPDQWVYHHTKAYVCLEHILPLKFMMHLVSILKLYIVTGSGVRLQHGNPVCIQTRLRFAKGCFNHLVKYRIFCHHNTKPIYRFRNFSPELVGSFEMFSHCDWTAWMFLERCDGFCNCAFLWPLVYQQTRFCLSMLIVHMYAYGWSNARFTVCSRVSAVWGCCPLARIYSWS